MPETKIVLKCKQGQAGINAAIEVDGILDPAWSMQEKNCDDVRDLYERAVKHFGKVEISPSCAECFSEFPFPRKD